MQTESTFTHPASHRIDLESAYRVDPATGRSSGHGKDRMFFEGEFIGESRQPAFDAARVLLARGLALPCDRLTTFRSDRPCLLTTVGRGAKLTVEEDGKSGLRIRAYRPLPPTLGTGGTPNGVAAASALTISTEVVMV